uniref:MFS domain-containing protein n=1 Tax=Panagrellus redivivus TaxID=6233 RepID=A0A7E4ZXX7_PANRE
MEPVEEDTPPPKSQWALRFAQFKVAISDLGVYPIIFLVYFGWVFGNTFQSAQLYRRICEIYYDNISYINCYHLDNDDVEDKVQQHAAEWSLYNALAYLVPAVLADTILGSYGDKYGRQFTILIGIVGVAVSEFVYLLTLSRSVAAPYWITTVSGIFTGLSGYIALIPVSCNAYLADTTRDSDVLLMRSGIFTVTQSVASVLGGLIAAVLPDVQIAIAMDVELFFYCMAFGYTIWKIPQSPGFREIERRSRQSIVTLANPVPDTLKKFFQEIWEHLQSGVKTYIRPRIGHRRAFIFITAWTIMVTCTASVETQMSQVLNSYVFRRAADGALDWTTDDLGYWNAFGFVVLIIGTIFGLWLFKNRLHLPETIIISIALISGILRTTAIGLSTKTWHMWLANVFGVFTGLVQPATASFIVQLVPPDEVGKTFSLFGIASDVAFIVTFAVYNNIYRATVHFFPGFMFIFIGLVQLITLGAMAWVHIQCVKEGVFGSGDSGVDIERAIANIGRQMADSDGPLGVHRPSKFSRRTTETGSFE